MSETHTATFDYFDLEVVVTDTGDVNIKLRFPEPVESVGMNWDDFREAIDFVAKHGMGMSNPYLVEYEETREAMNA